MESMIDSAPASSPELRTPPVGEERFTVATVNPRIPLLTLGLVLLTVLTVWIFGHLPWVLDGFRARADQRTGATADGVNQVRLVIPLIADQLTVLVAYSAVGALAATLLPLAFPDIPRGLAVVTAALTVAATTLVLALLARSSITGHATDSFAGDDRVLDGLVVGVFVVVACAGLLGCLASFQIGFLPLAVAVLVGQLPVWIDNLGASAGLSSAAYRIAAVVLLTAAFVISVRRTLWWAVLWPVALLLFWTAWPLWFATWRMQDRLHAGAGLTADNLSDVFAQGRDGFAMVYWHSQQNWWVGVVAAVIAAAWQLVRRQRTSSDS